MRIVVSDFLTLDGVMQGRGGKDTVEAVRELRGAAPARTYLSSAAATSHRR